VVAAEHLAGDHAGLNLVKLSHKFGKERAALRIEQWPPRVLPRFGMHDVDAVGPILGTVVCGVERAEQMLLSDLVSSSIQARTLHVDF
jgi:hypothetical protein